MIIRKWKDKNGLVKPWNGWQDSGNGVLYSCIWLILERLNPMPDEEAADDIEAAIFYCVVNGNLYRTPTNDYGQEQWDNHLGLAAYCYFSKNKFIARAVLWRCVKNFGFFDTDGKLEAKDFLLRFPQVWVVYFMAAFPILKWFALLPAMLISAFMRPNLNDSSGCQLIWLYRYVMKDAFGDIFDEDYAIARKAYRVTVDDYYETGHAISILTRLL